MKQTKRKGIFVSFRSIESRLYQAELLNFIKFCFIIQSQVAYTISRSVSYAQGIKCTSARIITSWMAAATSSNCRIIITSVPTLFTIEHIIFFENHRHCFYIERTKPNQKEINNEIVTAASKDKLNWHWFNDASRHAFSISLSRWKLSLQVIKCSYAIELVAFAHSGAFNSALSTLNACALWSCMHENIELFRFHCNSRSIMSKYLISRQYMFCCCFSFFFCWCY